MPGRVLRLVPVGGRRRQRVDDENDDPARAVERRWHAGFVQRLEDFQRIEHGAHADVVRDAAVDEMQVGPMHAVADRPPRALSERIARAAGRGGFVGFDERLRPRGRASRCTCRHSC